MEAVIMIFLIPSYLGANLAFKYLKLFDATKLGKVKIINVVIKSAYPG